MPRFVEVIADQPAFIDADKIVSLELDPPCWVATTADQRTFKLSMDIAKIILAEAPTIPHGLIRLRQPRPPQPSDQRSCSSCCSSF